MGTKTVVLAIVLVHHQEDVDRDILLTLGGGDAVEFAGPEAERHHRPVGENVQIVGRDGHVIEPVSRHAA